MNFTLEHEDIKELPKLYPFIRIPYKKEYNYYLGLLDLKYPVKDTVESFLDCKEKNGKVSSYKMKKFDEILKYFKEDTDLMERFNAAEIPNINLANPLFKNMQKTSIFHDGMVYVSVDMKQANFNIFQDVVQEKLGTWKEFMSKFDMHPVIVESKTYRQLLFGNLNPGRQQTFQKMYMFDCAGHIAASLEHESKIVSISADEVLIETTHELVDDLLDTLHRLTFRLPMKIQPFTIQKFESHGETVAVKLPYYFTSMIEGEFHSIQGSRFFMHYNKLMLNRVLNEKDLLFEPEPGRLAKWMLD